MNRTQYTWIAYMCGCLFHGLFLVYIVHFICKVNLRSGKNATFFGHCWFYLFRKCKHVSFVGFSVFIMLAEWAFSVHWRCHRQITTHQYSTEHVIITTQENTITAYLCSNNNNSINTKSARNGQRGKERERRKEKKRKETRKLKLAFKNIENEA